MTSKVYVIKQGDHGKCKQSNIDYDKQTQGINNLYNKKKQKLLVIKQLWWYRCIRLYLIHVISKCPEIKYIHHVIIQPVDYTKDNYFCVEH